VAGTPKKKGSKQRHGLLLEKGAWLFLSRTDYQGRKKQRGQIEIAVYDRRARERNSRLRHRPDVPDDCTRVEPRLRLNNVLANLPDVDFKLDRLRFLCIPNVKADRRSDAVVAATFSETFLFDVVLHDDARVRTKARKAFDEAGDAVGLVPPAKLVESHVRPLLRRIVAALLGEDE